MGRLELLLLLPLAPLLEISMERLKQSGFFLLEVVIASAVMATILIFLVGSIQDSVEVSQRALERSQSAYLLEEGMEAVKSIRNQSNGWTTLTGFSAGTTYYLSWSGSAWSLTEAPSAIGGFTRTIVMSSVNRDANDDIAEVGTDDPGTKKFTVTVTWNTSNGAKTETLSFYITDIHG